MALALPALLCVLLVDSCDLLRLTPLTVAAWTPGDGFHGAADARVSITFSSEPDRASAEDSSPWPAMAIRFQADSNGMERQ